MDTVNEIRSVLTDRVRDFVAREFEEFKSDPRWLLQEECTVTGSVARDLIDTVISAQSKTEVSRTKVTGRSHDLGAAGSGFGHGGGCCPPVVDQYTWLALITGIALATYFLRVAVTTNIMGRRKRRKREEGVRLNFLETGAFWSKEISLNAHFQTEKVYL